MPAQRSWLYFFIGVILSTFVGGGLRVFLSPSTISKWVQILVEKKESRFYFKFKTAELSLAKGWRPHFAIELSSVEFGAHDRCLSASTLFADRLIVPINLFAFIQDKKVQFGDIFIDQLRADLRPTMGCGGPSVNDELAEIEQFFSNRWNKEIGNTLRYLNSLSVQSLKFYTDDAVAPLASLDELNLSFHPNKNTGQLHFIFWPGTKWSGGLNFGPTRVQIEIDSNGVEWSGRSNLKEGPIFFDGRWDVAQTDLSAQLNWRDVPASSFFSLLSKWKIVSLENFNPKHQWISCEVSISGSVREWSAIDFKIGNCFSKGELGDFYFQAQKSLKVLKGHLFPLDVVAHKVDVKKALAAFSFPSVKNMGQYGFATGQFQFKGLNEWQAQGEITQADVYLRAFDEGRRLPFGNAQIEAQLVNDKIVGRIFSNNAFDLAAVTELRFEKSVQSDVTLLNWVTQIGENSPPFKRLFIWPYRTLKLEVEAKLGQFDFYSVKGSTSIHGVSVMSSNGYYDVFKRAFKEKVGPLVFEVLSFEGQFSFLDDSFYLDGSGQTLKNSFRFEGLVELQTGQYLNAKLESIGPPVLLKGSHEAPLIQ